MEKKELIERIKEYFARGTFRSWESRERAQEFLEAMGFRLWANTWVGKSINFDEEIWGFDVGTPNGQILVLINWVDGFVWFYEKTDRCDIGGE